MLSASSFEEPGKLSFGPTVGIVFWVIFGIAVGHMNNFLSRMSLASLFFAIYFPNDDFLMMHRKQKFAIYFPNADLFDD